MNSPAPTLTLPRRMPLLALAAAALAGAAVAIALTTQGASRAPHRTTLVAEAPDPLASQSFPDPAGARAHARAAAPSVAAAAAQISPGAPSNAEVQRDLKQLHKVERATGKHSQAAYIDPASGAFAPSNVVPPAITKLIAGGNAIADFPYLYGGGHASFVDRAYDCSGSVSYALAAAGLIGAPETSGQLERWGARGPGRWMTVFANTGHTFMYVDGVWFDTAGRAGPHATRWLTAQPDVNGYVERHYPGL
jgi:cell wall-associated NlpC family hydrolase